MCKMLISREGYKNLFSLKNLINNKNNNINKNLINKKLNNYNYKCNYLMFIFYILMCSLFMLNNVIDCKNLDHIQDKTCENVKEIFEILNITSQPNFDKTGPICTGHCCDASAENGLMIKSTRTFQQLLRHHTQSLRGSLESMSFTFREHVLELSHQSENKTLNLFSQVYRRMSPLSRQPILELYDSIRSHISSKVYIDKLESVVNKFFINLFPVAYHLAVHTSSENLNSDFHIDYKNCLTHTYDELKPFGDVPKKLATSLVQSVGAASVFVRSLDRATIVLLNTEELDAEYLSEKCKTHLLKMTYCPECKGITKKKIKTCTGYCLNVMRGCLTQYVGSLDSPWSSFVESIERLAHLVKSKDGIEEVIKSLDGKLSEAIMHAMVHGPSLEKKVKRACGAPTLLKTEKLPSDDMLSITPVTTHVIPRDTEMLYFLATLDKSRDLYSKIVDNLCEDDEYEKNDRNCWTGSNLGEYSQTVMSTSVISQRYNPEVPFEAHNSQRANKLSELSDRLIDLQRTVASARTQYWSHVDAEKMQSDMAEGSGYSIDTMDDSDDFGGSGSGGGKDNTNTAVVDVSTMDNTGRTIVHKTDGGGTASDAKNLNRISNLIISLSLILSVAVIFNRRL